MSYEYTYIFKFKLLSTSYFNLSKTKQKVNILYKAVNPHLFHPLKIRK